MYIGYIFGGVCLVICFLGILTTSEDDIMKMFAGIGWLAILALGISLCIINYLDLQDRDNVELVYGEVYSITKYDNTTSIIKVDSIEFETTLDLKIGDIVKVKYTKSKESDLISEETVYEPSSIEELKVID
jgi:hypothetical protein